MSHCGSLDAFPVHLRKAQVDYVVTPALDSSPGMVLLARNLSGAEPGNVHRQADPTWDVAAGSVLVGGGAGAVEEVRGERDRNRQRKTESPPPLLGQKQLRGGLTRSGCSRGWSSGLPGLTAPASRIRSALRRAFSSAERCPPPPTLSRSEKRSGRGCALDWRGRGAPWWQVWGAKRRAPAAGPDPRRSQHCSPCSREVRPSRESSSSPGCGVLPQTWWGCSEKRVLSCRVQGPIGWGPRDAAGVTRARGVQLPWRPHTSGAEADKHDSRFRGWWAVPPSPCARALVGGDGGICARGLQTYFLICTGTFRSVCAPRGSGFQRPVAQRRVRTTLLPAPGWRVPALPYPALRTLQPLRSLHARSEFRADSNRCGRGCRLLVVCSCYRFSPLVGATLPSSQHQGASQRWRRMPGDLGGQCL